MFYRVRYHAARGLIYLGCLDVGGVYLFKRVPGTTIFLACMAGRRKGKTTAGELGGEG